MGYDIVAYFDIDQDDLRRRFPDARAVSHEIVEYLVHKHGLPTHMDIRAKYNEVCAMFELMTSRSATFIIEDERFSNRRYRAELERRNGKPFPHCLKFICGMSDRQGALEIAQGLEEFFGDDSSVVDFARWLRATAPHCATYESSL